MQAILPPYFAYIGAATSTTGGILYWLDVVRGKTKPNIVTWSFWFLIPLITLVAQISSGVKHEAALTLAFALTPLLITLTAVLKANARWRVGKFDLIMGGLAVIGIGLWQTTQNPAWAVIFTVLADFSAALPTVIKTFKFPETESPMAFVWSGVGSLLVLLTISHWAIENYLFSFYSFIISWLIVILGKRKVIFRA